MFKYITRYRYCLALFAIAVFGVALRLINISEEPFWGDEILSLDIARSFGSTSEMVRYLSWVEIHPPGYYIILRYWIFYFGSSAASVRSLSVLFGTGIIFLTYFLTQELFKKRRISLFAAFLIAVLPIQIEFSAEARPYAMFTFFAVLSSIALFKYLKNYKIRWVLVYFACSSIGFYLHYSYFLFFLPISLFWLGFIIKGDLKQRKHYFFIWLFVHVAVCCVFYFWLDEFLYKIIIGRYNLFGAQRVTGISLRNSVFIESIYNQLIWTARNSLNQTLSIRASYGIEILSSFLAKIAIFSSVLYLVARRRIFEADFLKSRKKEIIFLFWMSLAPVAIFLFAPYSQQYTNLIERHIFFVSVFLAVILSLIIISLPRRACFLVSAFFFLSILNYIIIVVSNDELYDFQFSLRNMAEHVANKYKQGDIVIISASFTRTDFNYYLPDDIECFGLYPLHLIEKENDFLATRRLLGLFENESQLRSLYQADDKVFMNLKMKYLVKKYNATGVWLVFLEGNQIISDWLVSHGFSKKIWSFGDLLNVQLYRID